MTIPAGGKLRVAKVLRREGLAGFELVTEAVFLALLDDLRPGWFFDVGANVGVYSILASGLTPMRVAAFEPTPQVAAALEWIVQRNGLAVHVEEMALGREDGRATLYLSSASDASNSLSPTHRVARGSVEVTVARLDSYCRRTHRWPSVIKLDTETTEADVLAGAPEVLLRRPWVICEVLRGAPSDQLTALLEPHRYRWHHIGPGPTLEELPALSGFSGEGRNWLFAPEPLPNQFHERVVRWVAAITEAGGGTEQRQETRPVPRRC